MPFAGAGIPPDPPGPRPPATRPEGFRALAHVLRHLPGRSYSGVVAVAGSPGGALRIVDGNVIAVWSAGTPDVAALLPHRVRIGAAERQLVCLMAAFDAAFAIGMGEAPGVNTEPTPVVPELPCHQSLEPDRLLDETARRMAAVHALRTPVHPYRHTPQPTPHGAALLDRGTADERTAILRHADGRRSPRDIAFRVGRGLYAVTVELSRMLADGLVDIRASPGGAPGNG
ncbi:MAG: hypothetical protein HOV68_09045, partial [Streptomycetaceae bacterium]|nr:hypothetical protein [Streptomycetaceae bacterium]